MNRDQSRAAPSHFISEVGGESSIKVSRSGPFRAVNQHLGWPDDCCARNDFVMSMGSPQLQKKGCVQAEGREGDIAPIDSQTYVVLVRDNYHSSTSASAGVSNPPKKHTHTRTT